MSVVSSPGSYEPQLKVPNPDDVLNGEALLALVRTIRADLVETTNLLNKVASRLFALEEHVYARHPPLNNCPKCGAKIIGTMTSCPKCNTKMSRTSMS